MARNLKLFWTKHLFTGLLSFDLHAWSKSEESDGDADYDEDNGNQGSLYKNLIYLVTWRDHVVLIVTLVSLVMSL